MNSPKFITAALAAVATFGIAGTATAQSFNGPYVGGQIGWQHDGGTLDLRGPNIDIEESADSFVGGVFAGYDAEVSPSFVLGGEVGVDFGGNTVDALAAKAKRTIAVTARAGTLVNPQTLLYVRGGYANARYRFGDEAFSLRSNRDGWLAGAGVERAFTENVSARLEYRYSDFGDLTDVARSFNLAADEASFDRHQVLVGVSYRF